MEAWLGGNFLLLFSNNTMDNQDIKNIACIDGQNLYMGTVKKEVDPWKIDLARLRVYLKQKLHVDRAYFILDMLIISTKICTKKCSEQVLF